MANPGIVLSERWRIVVGAARSAVEDRAAADLQSFLRERLDVQVEVVCEDRATGTDEIVIGTTQSSHLVRQAGAERKLASKVGHPGSEGFELLALEGCVLVCGSDPTGVMYGVFHLEDCIADGELTSGLYVAREPFFKERSCGTQWSQRKPTHFSEEDLASWLAHHCFNLYGPIIQPWYSTNLSCEVAAGYGIRSSVAVEPPRPTVEFMREHPEWVEYDRRGAVQWGPSPTMCFRTEDTKRVFSEWIQRTVKENPTATQLTMYFGDLNCICADQCPRCASTPYPLRAVEVLEFLGAEARKINPDIKLIGQTWILHGAEEVVQILDRTPPGLGIQMNEPALAERTGAAGFGAQDVWLGTYELDDVLGPIYLRAGKQRKDGFYPLMGIGDSCESVDPVIGVPLPWLVGRKVRRAAENGMINLCVWWGVHPWVYTPNYEVVREMVFEPFQDIDALVMRIARRDFGEAAFQEVAETWRAVDDAFACWQPKVNWMERLEEYTGRCTRRAFFVPLTESIMEQEWSQKGQDWALSMSKSDKIDWWAYRNLDILVQVRRNMCDKLADAVRHAGQALALSTGKCQVRATQQHNWLRLLYYLFLSQYHYFRTLEYEKEGLDDEAALQQWKAVVEAEAATCEDVLALIDDLGEEVSNLSGLSRTVFEDQMALTLKIKQMRHGISPGQVAKTVRHKAQRMRDILSACPQAAGGGG